MIRIRAAWVARESQYSQAWDEDAKKAKKVFNEWVSSAAFKKWIATPVESSAEQQKYKAWIHEEMAWFQKEREREQKLKGAKKTTASTNTSGSANSNTNSAV